MKRLNYLIKIKSSFGLLKSYIENSLIFHLEKKERKAFDSTYKNFINRKSLSFDYFSKNTYDWIKILNEFKDKDFKYLEIGSFEGNSTLFILNNFKKSHVSCVDSWVQLNENDGSREGYEHLPISKIEKNFDKNLYQYQSRYEKFKMRSNIFFKKNSNKFDVIFVDGSHYAKEVFNDFRESWSILKKNGILILDDYFWARYQKLDENPAFAINSYLKKITNEYKIIRLSKYQLFLRKI